MFANMCLQLVPQSTFSSSSASAQVASSYGLETSTSWSNQGSLTTIITPTMTASPATSIDTNAIAQVDSGTLSTTQASSKSADGVFVTPSTSTTAYAVMNGGEKAEAYLYPLLALLVPALAMLML